MDTVREFEEKKYVYLQGFLDKDNCRELTNELKRLVAKGKTQKDEQCPISEAIHGSPTFDSLLEQLLPHFETVSGKKLYPTYSYARLYKPGERLEIHTDRPACEISATLTLGFEGNPWPIFMADYCEEGEGEEVTTQQGDKKFVKNKSKIIMNVGDAVLYRGMEKVHWRKKYKQGQWQAQVFLHYVDANGPHANQKYDGRSNLGTDVRMKNVKPPEDYRCWVYTDVLTKEACDIIVRTYTQQAVEKIDAQVGGGGDGVVNKEIRNVTKVQLPIYKDIGGRLAAVGFNANQQVWKFNITHCNQSEFLIYPPGGGRYKAHTDTFMNPGHEECRKLTVLAFLNDDFEGGRFFLQDGHDKFYPPQAKGTILVFPSWILHGVEDVITGTRYSVVAWMVGPWFK